MSDMPKPPSLLTVQEVADLLRVHQRTAYRLITKGDIKAIKIGSQWRVPEAALLEFIEFGWKTAAKRQPKPGKGPQQMWLPLDEEDGHDGKDS